MELPTIGVVAVAIGREQLDFLVNVVRDSQYSSALCPYTCLGPTEGQLGPQRGQVNGQSRAEQEQLTAPFNAAGGEEFSTRKGPLRVPVMDSYVILDGAVNRGPGPGGGAKLVASVSFRRGGAIHVG